MRIHHLNCISTCPLGGKLMDGRSESIVRRGELACHCLLVETAAALVLIDTGLGLRDVAEPKTRLSAMFLGLLSPAFREEMTAVRQVQRLGFDPRDVRHIVLTHLDFDHAGGLDDFPQATVHMMATERDYAMAQKTWLDRQRFRPQQWSTKGRWRAYSAAAGERWFGFERVRALDGVPPEIVMVPLAGHAQRCTPGLRFYQWMMEKDRASRLLNPRRVRGLNRAQPRQVSIFCGHDILEFERLAGHSARVPAERMSGRVIPAA